MALAAWDPNAYQWIDFLERSGCGLWQVLPLGPTGYGDSPYQAFSAFAGNVYLISPTLLLADGLLADADLLDRPDFPPDHVEYGDVITWKLTILERAFASYQNSSLPELKSELAKFQASQAGWLEDFALFMAIKESQGGVSWDQWPKPLRNRDEKALNTFRRSNPDAIQRHIFRQFLFFRQWGSLHAYANQKGIRSSGIFLFSWLTTVPKFGLSPTCSIWISGQTHRGGRCAA